MDFLLNFGQLDVHLSDQTTHLKVVVHSFLHSGLHNGALHELVRSFKLQYKCFMIQGFRSTEFSHDHCSLVLGFLGAI